MVSEPDQNTNTYPHPEREETVADEPPEVQLYKKQGAMPEKGRGGRGTKKNREKLERSRGFQLPLT